MSETDKENDLKNKEEVQTQRVEQKNDQVIVHLKTPIKREGGKQIKSITLNEPEYKQMEEFTMEDLNKVAVLPVLIPRIAQEEVFAADIESMKLSDLAPLNMALAAFI